MIYNKYNAVNNTKDLDTTINKYFILNSFLSKDHINIKNKLDNNIKELYEGLTERERELFKKKNEYNKQLSELKEGNSDIVNKKLKMEGMLVDYLLKGNWTLYNIPLYFEFLHTYRKIHPEKQGLTEKLNELAKQIFQQKYTKISSIKEKKDLDKKLRHSPDALITLEKLIIDYIFNTQYPPELASYIYLYDSQANYKEKEKEIKNLLSNLTSVIYNRIYNTSKKDTLNKVLDEIPELRLALESMSNKV
jgi:hypothetical protein